jgi:phage baseplate assembly protein W
MIRHDFAFPFRISPGSSQAAQADYQDHVEQLIRQVLLTDPGERVCLPEFGAGLRRLLFQPLSVTLKASTQIVVLQSLKRWLGDQIVVRDVSVSTAEDGLGAPEGGILIGVEYELIETRAAKAVQVRVI